MKQIYKYALSSVFLGLGWTSANACTGGSNAGTINTTGSWETQAVENGEYFEFEGIAGETYQFSFCGNGSSASWDTQLSVLNSGGGQLAYNDDYCGLQSYLSWYCGTAGTYRILISEYYCNNNGGYTGTFAFLGPPPPFANDAGIASIISPSVPRCASDSTEITVELTNIGSDTLNDCDIVWSVNSGSTSSYSYTGSVAPGAVDTVTVLSSYLFASGDNLKIWSENPNGVQDSIPLNDTSEVTLVDGLSGTYSIPGDYASINEAAVALSTYGVCDHTIFNLATGTYNEQASFGEIAGTSDSATVTFQSGSGNTNDVLIQFDASNLNNNYVIQFNGGDWITFKNLRMKSLDQYSYGCVLNVKTGSNNNTIDSCWLKGNSYQTTSNYPANIRWEGSSDGFSLTNSLVENGSQSMYMLSGNTGDPSEDMTIQGNIIKNGLYYQMYMYAIDGFILDDNTITNDSALYGGSYGYYQLYMYSVNNFDITKNYIGHDVGNGYYYPLYLNNCVGRNNPRSQFSNNCVFAATDGATSYNYYGTYMYNSGVMDMHNNSITRRGGFGGSYAALYINNGGLISLKNNSIANYAGGYGLRIQGGFAITESDHNNIYNSSGAPVYFGNSQYSTIEDYSAASGFDENSVSTDPNFETSLTCITCNDTLNSAGQALTTITDDISGNVRSAITPDIGAVEFVAPGSFTLGGDDTLCGNETIVEAGPAQSVTWNVNNQTSTQSSVTLTATNEPVTYNISVSITTEYCGSGSDSAIIRLIPDATLDSATHICADATVTLAPGGGSNATYAWSSGENTATLDVDAAGTYSVTKMEEGCESMASIAATKSQGVDIADIEGCEDDAPLSVDATIADGTSYAWSDGSSINTASNDFSTSGSYSVTATDAFGCVSTSDFDLLVLGAPDADISYTGSAGTAFHFSSAGSSNISSNTTYLWTFNSIDTSSAANPTYVFPWNGNPTTYAVSLVIDNGCGQDPAETSIKVDPLSVNDINTANFTVYPNPTSDIINITLGSEVAEAGMVEVMDITGRILNAERVASGQSVATIDLSNLASGSYLVKVSVDGISSVTSVVKQ